LALKWNKFFEFPQVLLPFEEKNTGVSFFAEKMFYILRTEFMHSPSLFPMEHVFAKVL
jgi:hypothetical protein